MKLLTHIIIWLLNLLSLYVIYSLLIYFVSDEKTYSWYVDRYGVIMENQWYGRYMMIIMLVAIFISCALIWVIVSVYNAQAYRVMKPINHIITWLLELLSLSIIFTFLSFLVPDEKIFSWYQDKYGMMAENEWYDGYTTILMLVAIFINCLLIWILTSLCKKNHSA